MKKWIVLLIAMAFTGLVFWSCSDDSPTKPKTPPTYTDEGDIGTIGGTVIIDDAESPLDGAYVKIPEGALSTTQTVSISVDETVKFPDDTLAVIIKLEPSGLTFANPVELALPVPTGADTQNLRVYYYNPSTFEVEQIPVKVIENGLVKAEITHFSYYTATHRGVDMAMELLNINGNAGVRFNLADYFGIAAKNSSDGTLGNIYQTSQLTQYVTRYEVTLGVEGSADAGKKTLAVDVVRNGTQYDAVYKYNTSGTTYEDVYQKTAITQGEIEAWVDGSVLVVGFNANSTTAQYYAKVRMDVNKQLNGTGTTMISLIYNFNGQEGRQPLSEMTSYNNDQNDNYIDDSYEGVPQPDPIIGATPTSLSFGNVAIDSHYDQTFTLTGSNLTADITVNAPTGYQVSASSGSGFASSISFPPTSGSVNSTVYVRFSPTAEQTYSGNITLVSTGATTVNVAVTGTGFVYTPGEMVLIPAGTFTMGDNLGDGYSDETPTHSVTLNSFYMGATEVTQAEWSAYMPAENWSFYGTGDTYPAYYVSWYEIIKYCNLRSMAEGLNPAYTINSSTNPAVWGAVPTSGNDPVWDAVICNFSANGYRLPTEAEWEYAARGGLEGQRFPNGATISHSTNGDTQANYYASTSSYSYDVSPTEGYHPDYNGTSSPVGSFNANGYGLYDMSGNLWEWCWDWYGSYMSDAQTNPTGPTSGSGRVFRGGSWSDGAYYCRVSDRYSYLPYDSDYVIGFRIVRTP